MENKLISVPAWIIVLFSLFVMQITENEIVAHLLMFCSIAVISNFSFVRRTASLIVVVSSFVFLFNQSKLLPNNIAISFLLLAFNSTHRSSYLIPMCSILISGIALEGHLFEIDVYKAEWLTMNIATSIGIISIALTQMAIRNSIEEQKNL